MQTAASMSSPKPIKTAAIPAGDSVSVPDGDSDGNINVDIDINVDGVHIDGVHVDSDINVDGVLTVLLTRALFNPITQQW